jgi:hypothetical protein
MFNFKIGDKITLKERKSHEYVRIIFIFGKWFVGICHRNKILLRSTKLNWIIFRGSLK